MQLAMLLVAQQSPVIYPIITMLAILVMYNLCCQKRPSKLSLEVLSIPRLFPFRHDTIIPQPPSLVNTQTRAESLYHRNQPRKQMGVYYDGITPV